MFIYAKVGHSKFIEISWPNKIHHKMDFYIFYLINKLFIAKTGDIINSYMHEKCFVHTYLVLQSQSLKI